MPTLSLLMLSGERDARPGLTLAVFVYELPDGNWLVRSQIDSETRDEVRVISLDRALDLIVRWIEKVQRFGCISSLT